MDKFQYTPSVMKQYTPKNEKAGDSSTSTNASSFKTKPRHGCDIMAEKFRAGFVPNLNKLPYTPKPFFFCGTLADPLRLQEVLQLPEPPLLKPARANGRKIMLWGQYPALVREEWSNYVDGMSYFIMTEEQQKMLEHYETNVYSVEGIWITIDG